MFDELHFGLQTTRTDSTSPGQAFIQNFHSNQKTLLFANIHVHIMSLN